jgi:hypothetical protein
VHAPEQGAEFVVMIHQDCRSVASDDLVFDSQFLAQAVDFGLTFGTFRCLFAISGRRPASVSAGASPTERRR